jgi:putative SOS response-associated peptidase YedK
MCGRFSLDRKKEVVEARFKAKLNLQVAEALPLFNIAPGKKALCQIKQEMDLVEWGLAGKGLDGKSRNMINARAETVLEKWPFKSLMQNRCLVIASGYIEWKTIGKTKIPFLHQLKEEPLFAMAGLFETDPETDKKKFTILTRPAGPVASELHDRMPLILSQEMENYWLTAPTIKPEDLGKLISEKEPSIKLFSISPRLNKSFENDPTLLQATPYSVVEQLRLF